MAQLAKELIPEALEAAALERQQCDSCSARAWVHVYLEVGHLYFCHHHYNKHASALHERNIRAARIYSEVEDI
jgi:hypothetical protein